eukprot:7354384-Pyramimonas_sp.AAC.1
MYLSPRIVRACQGHAETIWNRIVPGCAAANHAARAMIYVIWDRTHNAAPLAIAHEFVDDLHTRVGGHPEDFKEQFSCGSRYRGPRMRGV